MCVFLFTPTLLSVISANKNSSRCYLFISMLFSPELFFSLAGILIIWIDVFKTCIFHGFVAFIITKKVLKSTFSPVFISIFFNERKLCNNVPDSKCYWKPFLKMTFPT